MCSARLIGSQLAPGACRRFAHGRVRGESLLYHRADQARELGRLSAQDQLPEVDVAQDSLERAGRLGPMPSRRLAKVIDFRRRITLHANHRERDIEDLGFRFGLHGRDLILPTRWYGSKSVRTQALRPRIPGVYPDSGSSTMNELPSPRTLSTRIRPPWAWTIS